MAVWVTHEEGNYYGPIVPIRKLRLKELKWLAQGQASKEGQRWDLNWEPLIPEQELAAMMLLTCVLSYY